MLSTDRSIVLHASQSIGDAEIEALEIHPTVVLLDLDLRGRTPLSIYCAACVDGQRHCPFQ